MLLSEADDGWRYFTLPDYGTVGVALAKIGGRWEIVGLRLDLPAVQGHQLPSTQDERQGTVDFLVGRSRKGARPADLVINAEKVRRLPLHELKAAAAKSLSGQHGEWMEAFETVERQRGKRLPDSHYRHVAAIYRAAVEAEDPPLKAIQDHFHVSRAGAAKYVARARELDFLGYPTRRGVAGAEGTESPYPSRKERGNG